MKERIAKTIRIATIPPIMALIMLITIYVFRPLIFGNLLNFLLSVVFLVLFPILAYPLQRFIPKYKNEGRDGQRSLAIILSNAGYILGVIVAIPSAFLKERLIIHLTYFFSGLLILVFNKVLKIRASGHACGATGPIVVLIYFFGSSALWSLFLLAGIYWASLTIKRHTKLDLLLGTSLPIVALCLSVFFIKIV
jgi:hypothetical protein